MTYSQIRVLNAFGNSNVTTAEELCKKVPYWRAGMQSLLYKRFVERLPDGSYALTTSGTRLTHVAQEEGLRNT